MNPAWRSWAIRAWLALRWLGRSLRAVAVWLWRGWRFTWRGRGGQIGGARLVAVSVGLGVLIGCAMMWLGGQSSQVRYVLYGDPGELPRPVTPPPEGCSWTRVLTTGYCPCAICCPGTSDGITSTGRKVERHPFGIASDPRQVTPWLTLDIPGYGRAVVDDTGAAMRHSGERGIVHLDLRFADHQQARRWGTRWMWVAMPAGAPASGLPPPR